MMTKIQLEQIHDSKVLDIIEGYHKNNEEFSVVFNGKDSKAAKPHLEALRETIADTPFVINRTGSRRKSDKKAKRKANKSVKVIA